MIEFIDDRFLSPRPNERVAFSLFRGLVMVRQSRPAMVDLAKQIAASHQISPQGLLGEDRYREHTAARHELMWVLVKVWGYGHSQVGRFLKRNPSSVHQGVAKHESRLVAEGYDPSQSQPLGAAP